ncbi:MAG: ankyrin repeat domain-containing protein [Verrucomicrobiae bacterium]|nr:ankyrin repeat domain-containing protein [Verrucomicrobiae bacterium]
MSGKKIYLVVQGEASGPFTLDQVNGWLTQGSVKQDDYAWCEGLPDWGPLHNVLELANENFARFSRIRTVPKRKPDEPRTSLIAAAKLGDLETVRKALEKGANVSTRDQHDWSAMKWAATFGHAAILLTLIEHGGDVNERDNDGCTPLWWAVGGGHMEAVQLLLDHKADPNAANSSGATALTWAATHGNREIIRILISRGAKVNHSDRKGMTPLMHAAAKDNRGTVELLLENGADVSARTVSGVTALMLAAGRDGAKTVRYLVEKGASVGARDRYGRTATTLARQKGGSSTLRLLKQSYAFGYALAIWFGVLGLLRLPSFEEGAFTTIFEILLSGSLVYAAADIARKKRMGWIALWLLAPILLASLFPCPILSAGYNAALIAILVISIGLSIWYRRQKAELLI